MLTFSITENYIEELIAHLEDKYRTMGYIRPLPWGQDFPVGKVYIDRQCQVTIKGITSSANLSSILKKNTDMERVLVIAEIGYGKTTFQQYQAYLWLAKNKQQNRMNCYLFYN